MKIFPVIHTIEESQVIREAEKAHEAGADGVYLINDPPFDLLNSVSDLKERDLGFVGVNFLHHNTSSAYNIINWFQQHDLDNHVPDALWSDSVLDFPLFDEWDEQLEDMRVLKKMRKKHPELHDVTLLGGVAFKYTWHRTENPRRAAALSKMAGPYVDVLTTTGVGTGSATSARKACAMKNAVPHKELALASGIDIDNISDFTGIVDQVLVASSIETYPHSGVFDVARLTDIVEAAHSSEACVPTSPSTMD